MMDRATQDRAIQAGIRADVIRADCDYGESVQLRGAVWLLGFDYGLGMQVSTNATAAICCYAFMESERVRAFFPPSGGQGTTRWHLSAS